MRNKTCCFTGHRKLNTDIQPIIELRLHEENENLITQGFIYYGAGGALGFDTLAAKTVLKLRKKYNHIKLILVLPCIDQSNGWNEKNIIEYEKIFAQADKIVYISKESYSNGCMHKRNKHLVDNSSVCICYLTSLTGGTAFTAEYAKKKGVIVINIA